MVVHSEGTFEAHDGTSLYQQSWIPDEYKGSVLIVHGLAEHSGRYTHVAETLNKAGYAVYSFDGRGHGKSVKGGGAKPTAYYASLDDYTKDVDGMIQKIITTTTTTTDDDADAKGKPCFVWGHSMGGMMVTYHNIKYQPDNVAGIILTGPLVEVGSDVGYFIQGVARVLSYLVPKAGTQPLKSTSISRDAKVRDDYDKDPLNYRGSVPARVGSCMLQGMNTIQTEKSTITIPMLIMHGDADKVVDPNGSKGLYEGISSKDKKLRMWEGLYHEIHNEPEKDQVLAEMVAWLDERI
mmetsp:Transcript_29829/g.45685  ORF Transcript_29829/g.45685 Transcript_29829/m.45685 type:complete len:294 (-) Transcript_29829:85-966(-)